MRRSAAAVAAGLLLAGCGAARSGRSARPAPSARSKLAVAQATHEYPSPKAPQEAASAASASAAAAVRNFATAYINWTADTVAGDMRTLESRSIGQARSALQLAAAQTASDYELQQGGISNSGRVEVVAPLPSGRDQYVVVTREQTIATNTTAYQGLRPAWHVALATVSQVAPGAWVLSGWRPES
jgi:hypothetical protein